MFPLPNAVLLPKAILPLHVFEPRYRTMTEEALAGNRHIAIALLRPGFEKKYHTLDADVFPEVGVGRILKEERLQDGRFNLLLMGATRARLVSENKDRPYRRGQLRVINPSQIQPETECKLRKRLRALLATEPLATIARESNWTQLFACSSFSLSDVVDLIASVVVQKPEDKQCFLAEACVEARTNCICDVLESVCSGLITANVPRPWPPQTHQN
ncbi:MAG: LON peptidase substrate-binding domain-containing protein [Planctomycetes bacterium]|nr:LON peptidase substrate-binding domain-containing protein [Planctomycetota bacterium]